MTGTTDRELLELAAKAAGHRLEWERFNGGDFVGMQTVATIPKEVAGLTTWGKWEPLTDDGDALCLAVQLGFHIDFSYAEFVVVRTAGSDWKEFREPWSDDGKTATRRALIRSAATRRAIVRAAVEIGRCAQIKKSSPA